MKKSVLLFLAAGFCAALQTHATTVNADEAANYSTWTDGSNEGGGFEAWSISSAAGSGSATNGIWDSSEGELSMGDAFGFVATGEGSSIELSRDFSTAMNSGDIFAFDLGINYEPGEGGSRGFALCNASGDDIIIVRQTGTSDVIQVNGATSLTNYGTATMHWTFTQESSTNILVFATGRAGSENYAAQLTTETSAYIAGIRFFAEAITNDDYTAYRAVYFDNLSLSQGASSDDTFTYEIDNSRAIITDVSSNTSGAIIVPATLGGYPVTQIGRSAFMGCANITSVSFEDGDSVTNIGFNAFQNCTALQTAALPGGLTDLSDSLFYGCTNLASVSIPSGVTNLGSSVFSSCLSLAAVSLPKGLTALGESVFLNCRSLTALDIPEGITDIPGQFCCDCRSLADITLPAGITNISYLAFCNVQALETIDFPSSVTTIGDGAFKGCTSLASLEFDGVLTEIGDEAFYGCSALTSVTFTGSIETLGDAVFGQCTSLNSLYIYGDEPAAGDNLFISSDSVFVYYIANSSSWSSSLGSAAVSAWRPEITGMSDSNDTLRLTIKWADNYMIVLQASTNLADGTWDDVSSGTISNGTCTLDDPSGRSLQQRFYRAVNE